MTFIIRRKKYKNDDVKRENFSASDCDENFSFKPTVYIGILVFSGISTKILDIVFVDELWKVIFVINENGGSV